MTRRFFAPALLCGLLFAFPGCDIDQTKPAKAPDVDVDVKPGQAPAYDVDAPSVDVKTEEKKVNVPDVDVDVNQEEKIINVPDVDVTPADEDTNDN